MRSVLILSEDAEELCERVGDAGFAVTAARDAGEAVEPSFVASHDLVLLEAALPLAEHGIARWRSDPASAGVPIVILAHPHDGDAVVRCIAAGAIDCLLRPVEPVLLGVKVATYVELRRLRERESTHARQLLAERNWAADILDVVVPIGVALFVEQDFGSLLERIVLEAMRLCRADAGSLYLRSEDRLEFALMRTESMQIAVSAPSGGGGDQPALPLYDPATGTPNHSYVATHVALTGATLTIPDAYTAVGFDFSGPQTFDAQTGYRSTSFLVVPLKDAANRVIGVVQLINAQDAESGEVVAFDPAMQRIVESLSAIAAVALEAYLHREALRRQVEELRIEIDEAKKNRQVAEITDTDYFHHLQRRAKELRKRARGG